MPRKQMKLTALWLLLSLTLFGTGCTSTVAIDSCSWVRIITVSKEDVFTDQTAREILAHNRKVEETCSP